MNDAVIEPGDTVRVNFGDHTEDLIVGAVSDGHMRWLGWPPGRIALDRVSLVEKADTRTTSWAAEWAAKERTRS